MKTVYLSLGSNLGDRAAALQAAIDNLDSSDLRIVRISSVYETAAVDLVQQPDFLNCVVEGETALLPMRLLARTQRVEREMGRKRTVPKGPRVIDIDILLHGSAVVGSVRLTIPHPRMLERRFVLEPLAEIAPNLRHPLERRTLQELLPAVAGQRVKPTPLRLTLPAKP